MSREAFEAWYEQYRENACTLYGAIDCIHPEDIAFASWRAGWQAARDAALEEAAEVCMDLANVRLKSERTSSYCNQRAAECAQAIRALKEQG